MPSARAIPTGHRGDDRLPLREEGLELGLRGVQLLLELLALALLVGEVLLRGGHAAAVGALLQGLVVRGLGLPHALLGLRHGGAILRLAHAWGAGGT